MLLMSGIFAKVFSGPESPAKLDKQLRRTGDPSIIGHGTLRSSRKQSAGTVTFGVPTIGASTLYLLVLLDKCLKFINLGSCHLCNLQCQHDG